MQGRSDSSGLRRENRIRKFRTKNRRRILFARCNLPDFFQAFRGNSPAIRAESVSGDQQQSAPCKINALQASERASILSEPS